jgi:predicted dehydrogenase
MVARLSANFYVDGGKQGGSMEIHGDGGSAFLGDFQNFSAVVEARKYGKPYETVPYVRKPHSNAEFSRGVQDLAQAMLADRPHRTTGAQAAHVVAIVSTIIQAARDHRRLPVPQSTFTSPTPMDWALSRECR